MNAENDVCEYTSFAMEESIAKIRLLDDQLRESNYKVQHDVCI
jgi:hypothetical protein